MKQDRSSPQEREIAFGLIDWFTRTVNADVICLGEISEQDIALMREHWRDLGYSIREGVSPVGRTSFDTCVLYRSATLLLLDDADLSSTKGRSTLKIGQRLDFAVSDEETFFHLFISHWPSRLWCEENHADRHLLGIRLRDEIERTGLSTKVTHVVVLGDFNDEPFDKSISEQLMATRDRNLASQNLHLLYNPFWRHLGASEPYQIGGSTNSPSGSYYYKNGKQSKWRTFDQMIFSSSFLGQTAWHLREDLVKVIDWDNYTMSVLGPAMHFDHLPIMGVIEKVI